MTTLPRAHNMTPLHYAADYRDHALTYKAFRTFNARRNWVKRGAHRRVCDADALSPTERRAAVREMRGRK